MSKINDGGPAFPVSGVICHNDNGKEFLALSDMRGLSLRDYFAAAALQGMIASPAARFLILKEELAEEAYKQADAMLAERAKNGGAK